MVSKMLIPIITLNYKKLINFNLLKQPSSTYKSFYTKKSFYIPTIERSKKRE